jgi:hypothetical protein
MDILRGKNSFDFESSDDKFPYGRLDGIEVGSRKFVLFNYSVDYYRKKQGNGSGLYFIAGGNIPKNMASSVSVSGYVIGINQPKILTCPTNSGTAGPLGRIPELPPSSVINLSPNNLIEVPTVCDSPWPPEKEIMYEKAKQQKPNFMYFPAYQPSCSTHPRARGYAHEDNYDALKKEFGEGAYAPDLSFGGTNPFTCCDFFCPENAGGIQNPDVGVMPRFRGFVLNTGEIWNDGNNGLLYSSGCFIPLPGDDKPIIGGGALTMFVGSICCKNNASDTAVIGEECASNTGCNFGFGVSAGRTTGRLGGMCPSYTGGRGQLIEATMGTVSVVYQLSGNTDCGCTGRGGTVSLNGRIECTTCTYQDFTGGGGGSTPNVVKKKCAPAPLIGGSGIICSSIWNDKVNVAGIDVYVTTTGGWPSFKYPNGQGIELDDSGAVVSVGCSPKPRTCNDLN